MKEETKKFNQEVIKMVNELIEKMASYRDEANNLSIILLSRADEPIDKEGNNHSALTYGLGRHISGMLRKYFDDNPDTFEAVLAGEFKNINVIEVPIGMVTPGSDKDNLH